MRAKARTCTRTAQPRVLALDDRRDLALLKIDVHKPMRPVLLFSGDKTESGERVAVIGNPGAGETILDYTMTEGIVSSPDRQLAGQSFIQTSAQVNPGSSGGPMFDSSGLVIGIVDLKAQIEGAGFAIPANDIVDFILSSASIKGDDGKLNRHWTDSTGQHQIDAVLDGYSLGTVRLQRPDGTVIRVTLGKLSEADGRFLRSMKGKAAR